MSIFASALATILGSVYFVLGDNRPLVAALLALIISALALTTLRSRYKEIMTFLVFFLVVFFNYNLRAENIEFRAFSSLPVKKILEQKFIWYAPKTKALIISKTREKFFQNDYIVQIIDPNPLRDCFLPKRFVVSAPSQLGLDSGDFVILPEKIKLEKLNFYDRKFYRKDKVFYQVKKISIQYSGHKEDFVSKIQNAVAAYYYRTLSLPNYQTTLNLLFGSKAFKLDKDFAKQIRRLGLGHFFAASGFHLVVLSMAFNWILGLFKAGLKIRALTTLSVVLLYTALADFSPSILRSALFVIAFLFLQFFNRRLRSVRFLVILAGLTLLIDPYTIFDLGFQFSYLATLALFIWANSIQERLNFLPKFFLDIIAVTLAVQILLLPLTIYYFDNLQVWSILANIFFSPLLTVITLGSFFGLSFILEPSLNFLNFCVNYSQRLPWIDSTGHVGLTQMILLTIFINLFAILIFDPLKNIETKEFSVNNTFDQNLCNFFQKLFKDRYSTILLSMSSLALLLAMTLQPFGVHLYHVKNGLINHPEINRIVKTKKNYYAYFQIESHPALLIKSPRSLKQISKIPLREVTFLFLPNLNSKDIYLETLIKITKPQFIICSSYKDHPKVRANLRTIASNAHTILNSGILYISEKKFWSISGER